MATRIFVNLPVKDLARSTEFFAGLGFPLDQRFSDERAGCLVISDDIYAMLLTEPFFQTFTARDIPDTRKTAEAIVALEVDSRQRVDQLADQAYHIFIQATAHGRVRYDPQPGGIYLAYASGRRYGQRAGDLIISGEVLEAEPPKRLVQTWHPMFDTRAAAEPPTRLTWEIHQEQTGLTGVTVRHECPGAPQTAALASAEVAGSGGWSWVLSDLKTLLETGRPLTF